MIICPNCARENEDHYKFCLGCGTELSRAAAPAAPTALPVPRPAVVGALVGEPVEADEPPPVSDDAPPVDDELGGELTATVGVSADAVRTAIEDRPPLEDADTADADEGPEPSTDSAPFDEADLPDDDAYDVSEGGASGRSSLVGPPRPEEPAPAGDDGSDGEDGAPEDDARSADEPDEGPASAPTDPARPLDEDGQPAELPDPLGDAAESPAAAGGARLCRSCGAVVPQGFKFCGVCGSRYEASDGREAPAFVPPHLSSGAEAPARLIVIHPDGSEGESFPLGAGETTIGRAHPSPLFADDPFLSPQHATFYFLRGQLFVRDEGSLNGIFLRINAEVELFHGDMFRIGQQLLRFEEMRQVRPIVPGAGDGTTVMGSPMRGAWGRLSSVVAIDTAAAVWVLRRPTESLGRERGEILFPEDGFVSGSHCRLTWRDGRCFLLDVGSTNGTYLRIKGEGILARGDLVLLGQQLFKIDLRG